MRFFRRLAHFKAISFDLDDTLYDNYPVIIKAERALQQYLTELVPESAKLTRSFWQQHRASCLKINPQLSDDVTAVRLAALQSGMQSLGYSASQSAHNAQLAVDYFLTHRNRVTVSDSVKQTLTALATKYPLIAITNGNVGIEEIGLKPYFKHTFLAGKGNLKKPHQDMFAQTCDLLSIKRSELLHIGDCTHADIYGSLQAGCQTVWINNAEFSIRKKPLKLLPTAQIDCVEQLQILL